jgi:5-oxopent-3-ene-1,2,5-tricarboxylate decarboxylase/2-hydroxyhepta-2,4-diene-1,7-dioate isomerase
MAKAFVKISGMPHITEAEVDPETNKVVLNGTQFHVHEVSWEAPISGTVYGVLMNYKGVFEQYREQMANPPYYEPPKAPVLYIKPINTFNAYGGFIPLPKDTFELEVGASLGVVIGRTAIKVKEEKALDYVAGYTVVNDITIPHQSIYRPAIKEKARDGFCPIGPWVIEKEAVKDPNSLNIRVSVNGHVVQTNHTQNLVRPVDQLIAEITDFMTLYPGDVLLVGVPEHAPLVKAGDHVRIEIEGVGVLENTVVQEKDWVKEAFL